VIYVLSLFLSFVPGFVWLLFYLREEDRPEPARPLVRTFIYGCAFAFFTLAIQLGLKNVFGYYSIDFLSLFSVIVLALTEELFKFAAAYLSVHNDPAFIEPIDAMIYMAVAALGFATIENLGAIGAEPFTSSLVQGIFQTTTLRFVGATLLHTLASSLIGYYWAVSILRQGKVRFLLFGFILAVALHAAFNYLIISYGSLVYSIVFVVAAGFFVLHDFELLGEKKVNVQG
jgi:RsiW-degrading membrane proteinase PrsW (M82 family)